MILEYYEFHVQNAIFRKWMESQDQSLHTLQLNCYQFLYDKMTRFSEYFMFPFSIFATALNISRSDKNVVQFLKLYGTE